MRVALKELLDKMGVGYILSAYETCPWSAYEDENGITCSAEVRMDGSGEEIEAEMQIMRDNPEEDESPVEQVFWLLAKPAVSDQWDVKDVKIRGEGNTDDSYAFEEKAVNFFHACVQELKMGKVPDIDALLAREMKNNERYGGNSQGGGNKSPKIKPQALLGMKGGRGF
ncbi:MAG TPA: hypothetical protein PLK85_07365 [Alphaproteobacteria bacterium]|nr:hypothetical protein [Alphaproteobacteria bacterium]